MDGWDRLSAGAAALATAGRKYREEEDYKAGLNAVNERGEVDYSNPSLSTPGGLRGTQDAIRTRSSELELKAKKNAEEADEIMRVSAKAATEASYYSDPMQQFEAVYKRDYSKIKDGMDAVDGRFGEDGKFTVTYANKKQLDEQGQPKTTQVVYDDFDKFKAHTLEYPVQLAKARVQQAVQLDTYKRSLLYNDSADRRRAQLGLKPGDPLPDADRQTLNKTYFGDPSFITDTVKTFNANLENFDEIGKKMGWSDEQIKQYKNQFTIKALNLTERQPKVVSPGNMVPNKDGGGHSVVVENPDGSVETKPVKGGENVTTPGDSEKMGEIKTPQGKRYSLSNLDTAYRRMYNLPNENDMFLKRTLAASTKDPTAIKELEEIEKRKQSAPDFIAFLEDVRTNGAPWDREKKDASQPQPGDGSGAASVQTAPAGQPKVSAMDYKKRWDNAQASIKDPDQLTQYRANLEQHAMKNGISPAEF